MPPHPCNVQTATIQASVPRMSLASHTLPARTTVEPSLIRGTSIRRNDVGQSRRSLHRDIRVNRFHVTDAKVHPAPMEVWQHERGMRQQSFTGVEAQLRIEGRAILRRHHLPV